MLLGSKELAQQRAPIQRAPALPAILNRRLIRSTSHINNQHILRPQHRVPTQSIRSWHISNQTFFQHTSRTQQLRIYLRISHCNTCVKRERHQGDRASSIIRSHWQSICYAVLFVAERAKFYQRFPANEFVEGLFAVRFGCRDGMFFRVIEAGVVRCEASCIEGGWCLRRYR